MNTAALQRRKPRKALILFEREQTNDFVKKDSRFIFVDDDDAIFSPSSELKLYRDFRYTTVDEASAFDIDIVFRKLLNLLGLR